MERYFSQSKLMLCVVVLCAVSLAPSAGYASSLHLTSGGRALFEGLSPLLTKQGFAVPIDVAAAFGAQVVKEKDAFVIRYQRDRIILREESRQAKRTDGAIPLQFSPYRVGQTLYVPLVFLADLLHLKVSWDPQEQVLDLTQWTPFNFHLPVPVDPSPVNTDPPTATMGRTGEADGATSSKGTDTSNSVGSNSSIQADSRAAREPSGPTASLHLPKRSAAHQPEENPGGGKPTSRTERTGEKVNALITPPKVQGSLIIPGPAVDSLPVVGGVRSWLSPLQRHAEVDQSEEGKRENPGIWKELYEATGLRLTRTVTAGLTRYEFAAGDPVVLSTALLVQPPRLVVDVTGAKPAELAPLPIDSPLVARVRATAFEGKLRLIFDLNDAIGHRVVQLSDEDVRLTLLRPLRQIDMDVSASGGRINLGVSGQTSYKLVRLQNPDRLVVDLSDTTLVGGPVTLLPSAGSVDRVRAAQFLPDVTRVVLDLKERTAVEPTSIDGQLQLVYGDRLSPINYRVVDNRGVQIGIRADGDVDVYALSHPDRLAIDVHDMRLDAVYGDEVLPDGPVYRLRTSQFDAETVRIVADLRHYVRYGVERDGDRVVVTLREPLLTDANITVDAGHGGQDIGAPSPHLGLLEKDVNLDIASRLNELLQGAKAHVVMTRMDDSYPGLWERVKIAEKADSDIFVSVHNNTALSPSPSAEGTETFVRPDDPRSVALGSAIQRSLVSAVGSRDRGVRNNRGYLVVKHTVMPAALVEVGFLTDTEEEELLGEAWYRERAAEGIFNGILQYYHPDRRLSAEELAAADSGSLELSRWVPLKTEQLGDGSDGQAPGA